MPDAITDREVNKLIESHLFKSVPPFILPVRLLKRTGNTIATLHGDANHK